jgi:hypothetical protein
LQPRQRKENDVIPEVVKPSEVGVCSSAFLFSSSSSFFFFFIPSSSSKHPSFIQGANMSETAANETTRKVTEMHERVVALEDREEGLLHFVCHPTDFSLSVLNLFHLSFLIKQGLVSTRRTEAGFLIRMYRLSPSPSPFSKTAFFSLCSLSSGRAVVPTEADHSAGKANAKQFVFRLDYNVWVTFSSPHFFPFPTTSSHVLLSFSGTSQANQTQESNEGIFPRTLGNEDWKEKKRRRKNNHCLQNDNEDKYCPIVKVDVFGDEFQIIYSSFFSKPKVANIQKEDGSCTIPTEG